MKPSYEVKAQQAVELGRLLDWVGSQARLAYELGVSRQVVSNWVKRGRISATAAIEVEKKTDGMFKKEQLRPDVINWRE